MSESQTGDPEAERADVGSRRVDTRWTDQPTIGLAVEESTDPDAVAGAILRAADRDYSVIVEAETDHRHEGISFADRLGATVVRVERSAADGPAEPTVNRARELGYPGLVWVGAPVFDGDGDEPTGTWTQIDFEESTRELQQSQSYVVDAVPRSDTTTSDRVVVGIPAFNEEVGIGSVVLKATDYADEVIVVDDGSDDSTVSVAREAGASVVEHETNRGKGAAIQTLFQVASSTEFDSLVLLDGDGQHVTADIPDVADPVLDGDADVVIGSRYLDPDERTETPRHRRFGQRVLDLLTLGSSRVTVTDSQSGFRAFSPAAIEALSLKATSFGVESEMISQAADEDLTIEERPIDVRYDGIDGQTQNPLRHGLTVVTFILQLIRDRHPLLFFGVPGLLLTTVGAWYGVSAITIYQQTGMFYPAKVLVSGFATILGSLSIFIGLVLNRISNIVSQIDTD